GCYKLTFFLGLQVKQKNDGKFISHDKYVVEILRKFGLIDKKSASTPIDTENPLLKDPDGVNTPRCDEDRLELMELMVFLLPSDEIVGVKVYVVDLQVNDVTRLQALVDKKKVVITKASIRDALRLDDAKVAEGDDDEVYVADVNAAWVATEGVVSAADDKPSIPSPTPPTPPPQPSQDQPSTSQVYLTSPQSPQVQS
nr:copia protein [Tanacetum cinerariifolium]